MDALIPLLLIFVVLNSKQLSEDKLYRANVFAIVGIFYFVFLQYIYYCNRVFQVDGWSQFVPTLVAVLVAVGCSLSPWNKRSHIVKTGSLCALFIVSLSGTYMFDISIKEWLAEKGGFYRGELELPLVDNNGSRDRSFKFASIGLEMKAFDGWSKAQLSSGHEYLMYEPGGEQRVEARPNCLGEKKVDIPTYLSKILKSFESEKRSTSSGYQCEKHADIKECLVKVAYSPEAGGYQRWHWFAEKGGNRGVVIDFIVSREGGALQEQIKELIASTQILEGRTAEMCHTPAAWL
ncbi:hypothetical protein [Microbulbifer sp.]|uniref:hypothetical protein n=1 Tax=Microbulbifer sp. TaxID=1908541 RepID=UPI002583FDDC|nr:hypothetical protein [Microbulbifer sp.]